MAANDFRFTVFRVDVTRGVVMDANNSPVVAADHFIFNGDTVVLCFELLETLDGGNNYIPWQPDANAGLFNFMLKDENDFQGSALISKTPTAFQQGLWPLENLAGGLIACPATIASDNLTTFLGNNAEDSTPSWTLLAELEYNTGADRSTLAQFPITLRNQVITGTEGDPGATPGQYITLEEWQALWFGLFRDTSGERWIKDIDGTNRIKVSP